MRFKAGIFLFSTAFMKPHVQLVTRFLSLELRLRGREADHALQTSAVARNTWSFSSTSHMVWCVVMNEDNFMLLTEELGNNSEFLCPSD
jgi:hypothetical protein